MTIKTFIEKAIEGGWKPNRPTRFYDYSFEATLARQPGGMWSLKLEAALDPLA